MRPLYFLDPSFSYVQTFKRVFGQNSLNCREKKAESKIATAAIRQNSFVPFCAEKRIYRQSAIKQNLNQKYGLALPLTTKIQSCSTINMPSHPSSHSADTYVSENGIKYGGVIIDKDSTSSYKDSYTSNLSIELNSITIILKKCNYFKFSRDELFDTTSHTLALLNRMVEQSLIPEPTLITSSGSDITVRFVLLRSIPIYSVKEGKTVRNDKALFTFKKTQTLLVRQIQKYVLCDHEGLVLDDIYSTSPDSGYTRSVGTYNKISDKYESVIALSDRKYWLTDIIADFFTYSHFGDQNSKNNQPDKDSFDAILQKSENTKKQKYFFFRTRMEKLKKVFNDLLLSENSITQRAKYHFFFVLYNTLRIYLSAEDSKLFVLQTGRLLEQPIAEYILAPIFAATKIYHFTNATLIRYWHELPHILDIFTTKIEKRQIKRNIKKQRDFHIFEMFEQGYPLKSIALNNHVCIKTVQNVLKTKGEKYFHRIQTINKIEATKNSYRKTQTEFSFYLQQKKAKFFKGKRLSVYMKYYHKHRIDSLSFFKKMENISSKVNKNFRSLIGYVFQEKFAPIE